MIPIPKVTFYFCRINVLTVAAIFIITFAAWFVVPGPRWSLVTLGGLASLLLIAVSTAVFPVSRRTVTTLHLALLSCHIIAFGFTINVPATMTTGDPPGRMLSYVSIQSASHSLRYKVPLPDPIYKQLRIKLVLARAYSGPARLVVDVSQRLSGLMELPADGNLGEREFTFDAAPFKNSHSVLLTISLDTPDPALRIAVWKSALGRMFADQATYGTETGSTLGLPDPLTGEPINAWPLIWVTSL